MANSFGLLLAAIVMIFIIARVMRDAKAFTKLVATLAIGVIVGAGVKHLTKVNASEKTAVVSIESAPTCNDSASVVWKALPANLDYMSKDNNAERDSIETEAKGTPTVLQECEYQDDS